MVNHVSLDVSVNFSYELEAIQMSIYNEKLIVSVRNKSWDNNEKVYKWMRTRIEGFKRARHTFF